MQKITIVLAVGLLAVGACKKEEPASGSGGDKPGVAAPSGGIEVISNGAEPRKQLRYKVAKGTKTPVEFAMDIDMEAGMTMNMPTLLSLRRTTAPIPQPLRSFYATLADSGAVRRAPKRTQSPHESNLASSPRRSTCHRPSIAR